MIVLEKQANSNTNRYANRGGQLLKEERTRKAVQKVGTFLIPLPSERISVITSKICLNSGTPKSGSYIGEDDS